MISINPHPQIDCRNLFKAAYENRYTWDSDFPGYKGICIWNNGNHTHQGNFELGRDLKSKVSEIDDEIIHKSILSQLWEVAIHRVRRNFIDVHSGNYFYKGDINDIGLQVIVKGNNEGDFYRIKNNVITMVYRLIHGSYITIETKSITNTDCGYLSRKYISQYNDPNTGKQKSARSTFHDTFVQLYNNGPWVLSKRNIAVEAFQGSPENQLTYSFINLHKLR